MQKIITLNIPSSFQNTAENKISILLVEDEALIAENIKVQLEDFGYTVTAVCYRYETALTAVKECVFDVLITDINLGYNIEHKSGLQIAAHLKQTKNSPIIFLTAFSDTETIKKAAALSPSAYLVKPVNAANLYAAVQLAIENNNIKKTASPDEYENPEYFFIKHGTGMVKIFWQDIYHMEAIKNYVRIKVKEYPSGLLLRGSLQQILQTMVPDSCKSFFIRINRSEAIMKSSISKIKEGAVETMYGEYKTSNEFSKERLGS